MKCLALMQGKYTFTDNCKLLYKLFKTVLTETEAKNEVILDFV